MRSTAPYHDDRPLLVAGTPEVRKYRLRYWDKGLANGDCSDTATVVSQVNKTPCRDFGAEHQTKEHVSK